MQGVRLFWGVDMTKVNMTIEIEALLPANVSVEQFLDFLRVDSINGVEINILNSDILSEENDEDE